MNGSINNQIRPPINDPIAGNLMLTDIWFRYFNYFYQSILAALQYGISIPTITEAERDANVSYAQQRWVYVTDAAAGKEMQVNINGTWYYTTLTAV